MLHDRSALPVVPSKAHHLCVIVVPVPVFVHDVPARVPCWLIADPTAGAAALLAEPSLPAGL
jgi:hypothetical protein